MNCSTSNNSHLDKRLLDLMSQIGNNQQIDPPQTLVPAHQI